MAPFVAVSSPRPPAAPLWGPLGAILDQQSTTEQEAITKPTRSAWAPERSGWMLLTVLVLWPLAGGSLERPEASLNPRVADLILHVQLEPTGLGMWVSGPSGGSFETGHKRGTLLQTGRRLWLADVGLGPSRREVRRAALDLLQAARLQRGAMLGNVEVDLRGGQHVGWLEVRAVRQILADALGDPTGLPAAARIRIAWNSPGGVWSRSEPEAYSLVPGGRR